MNGRLQELNLTRCHRTRIRTYWTSDSNKIPDRRDFFTVKDLRYNCYKIDTCIYFYSNHVPVSGTIIQSVVLLAFIDRFRDRDCYKILLSALNNHSLWLPVEHIWTRPQTVNQRLKTLALTFPWRFVIKYLGVRVATYLTAH